MPVAEVDICSQFFPQSIAHTIIYLLTTRSITTTSMSNQQNNESNQQREETPGPEEGSSSQTNQQQGQSSQPRYPTQSGQYGASGRTELPQAEPYKSPYWIKNMRLPPQQYKELPAAPDFEEGETKVEYVIRMSKLGCSQVEAAAEYDKCENRDIAERRALYRVGTTQLKPAPPRGVRIVRARLDQSRLQAPGCRL